jgi:hypothetical protein
MEFLQTQFMELIAFATSWMTAGSAWLNEIAGGNEFLATGIGGAIAGALVYFRKFFTETIPNSIRRRVIVSITVDYDSSTGYEFECILAMIAGKVNSLGSRNFRVANSIYTRDKLAYEGLVEQTGIGFHWFMHKGRLYWVSIYDLESSGSEKQKLRLTMNTFGLTKKPLTEFLHEHSQKLNSDHVRVWKYDDKGDHQRPSWTSFPRVDALALDRNVADQMTNLFQDFAGRKEEYKNAGIPFKKTIMFHGEPGSGKSALLAALAQTVGIRDISIADIGTLAGNNSFNKIVQDVTERAQRTDCAIAKGKEMPGMLILEDIHGLDTLKKPEFQTGKGSNSLMDTITLESMLNQLNGVIPLENIIVVLTTNYIDQLDSALTRPGRIDHVIELPRISPETINSHIKKIVGEDDWKHFDPIEIPLRGCDVGTIVNTANFCAKAMAKNAKYVQTKIPAKPEYKFSDSNVYSFEE